MNETRTIIPIQDMQTMAQSIAASKMFGVDTEDQALALMLLCQAEGIHPVMALRRYHIIDGKPAYRADALQGEFEKEGAILWHQRNEKECSATFFRHREGTGDAGRARAQLRYEALRTGADASEFAAIGEITIMRTLEDAIEKRVAMAWSRDRNQWVMKRNWEQSPRQMLHARCLTEGVRAINPGLVAGIYTEDEIMDIPAAETYDQQPREDIAKRNVTQATNNALVEKGEEPIKEQEEVTSSNYGEVVVHIGKAQGEMLGKKVSELNPHIIDWLYTKWRDKLSPLSEERDLRLKTAVEYAHAAQQKPVEAPLTPPMAQDTFKLVQERTGAFNKVEAANKLIKRAEELILTPSTFSALLQRQGVLAEGQMLPDLSEASLRYLLSDEGWTVVKQSHEAEAKPTASDKPKKGRKAKK